MKHVIGFTVLSTGLWVGAASAQILKADKLPLVMAPGAATDKGAEVTWSLAQDASVIVQILNARGLAVRTLNAGVMAAGRHTAQADGLDAAGKRLPSGDYKVRIGVNLKAESDKSFGINGLLGSQTRSFTFPGGRRTLSMNLKQVEPQTVTLRIDGEVWERTSLFEGTQKTFVVNKTLGGLELNPKAPLKPGAKVDVGYGLGLPLENPWALATAPDGSLYIVDNIRELDLARKVVNPSRSGALYKVDASGKPAGTFAEGGLIKCDAKDVAVDQAGNIFLASIQHDIRVYDASGIQRYVIGGYVPIDTPGYGRESPAGGYWINSLAVNAADRLYFVNLNQAVAVYDASKPDLFGFLALQTAKEGALLPPVIGKYWGPCIAVTGDSFYRTAYRHQLAKQIYDPSSKSFSTVWSTPSKSEASFVASPSDVVGSLYHPMGLAVDGAGLIFVANRNLHRVEVFYDAGKTYQAVTFLGGKGTDASLCQAMAPHDVALSPDGRSLYVADDGFFFQLENQPEVHGLGRVVKWTLRYEESAEIPLIVK